jgi:23S rRNA (uracil1939-C5)-methyltransferase
MNQFEVEIEKLVYGGAGFGRRRGKVVFVPFSAPGDRLLVRPVEEKKTYIRAEIDRILKKGPGRAVPACPHFGRCGGCHWQHLEYGMQVESKRLILEELFHHRFPETKEIPIVMTACERPLGYRSRARVQLRGKGEKTQVGFYRQRSRTVEDIENCPLLRPPLDEALQSLRQYKLKVDTDASAREMDMACSTEEGTWATARVGIADEAGVTTLFGTRRREDVILRKTVGGFQYAVTASVFFQANDFMVPKLYGRVQELAAGGKRRSALDLFSGVGLFSLPLARQFETVVAVESSAAACRLCVSNARTAGLANVRVAAADVLSWMQTRESAGESSFDLIVLDPPRSGAGLEVMQLIGKWAPERIVYVSCDPQTLCRDLAGVVPLGYAIDLVEGLDMFPQTFHFETIVRLKKR